MDCENEYLPLDPNGIPFLPPPLSYSPLSLQRLAASALPLNLQEEIILVGDMLDPYADAAVIEPPPEFNDKTAWSTESLVPPQTFLLRRNQRASPQCDDVGIGVKVVGGVNCERCRTLHAVVKSVLPGTECANTVREGMLVTEWCGKKLDGLSYEHVLWLMTTTEEDIVEIVVRDPCIVRPQSNTTFQLRMSGHSSSSVHSSLRGRLSVFLGNTEVKPEELESDTSDSGSRRESDALGEEQQMDGFFASLPSGMVKLSIQYNRIEERLGVGLIQVKAQSLKDHDEAAIFVSVQIIPDERSQALKFTKLNGTPAVFHLMPTELASVALRVTLWESVDTKSAFRGEVLLRVLDRDTVTLNGDPSWYTICSPDPNLSLLEDPFDCGKSKHVEMQKGLGTAHQRRALKSLFMKTVSSMEMGGGASTPPMVGGRKGSLPTAVTTKASDMDRMRVAFATMMKKMKKRPNQQIQSSEPQPQIQPAEPHSHSQIQLQSVQSHSQIQLQSVQSHSHSQTQLQSVQSQSYSDQSEQFQPSTQHDGEEGDDGGGEEGEGGLQKLASIITTLRRDLSDKDLHHKLQPFLYQGPGVDCRVPSPSSEQLVMDVATTTTASGDMDDSNDVRGHPHDQGMTNHGDMEVCFQNEKCSWNDEKTAPFNISAGPSSNCPVSGSYPTNYSDQVRLGGSADDVTIAVTAMLPSRKGLPDPLLRNEIRVQSQTPPTADVLLPTTTTTTSAPSPPTTSDTYLPPVGPGGKHVIVPTITLMEANACDRQPRNTTPNLVVKQAARAEGEKKPFPQQEDACASQVELWHLQNYTAPYPSRVLPSVSPPTRHAGQSRSSKDQSNVAKCSNIPCVQIEGLVGEGGGGGGGGRDPPTLPLLNHVEQQPSVVRCAPPSLKAAASFHTKHRSRSLNDILSSSGEESAHTTTTASHRVVGMALPRDEGCVQPTTGSNDAQVESENVAIGKGGGSRASMVLPKHPPRREKTTQRGRKHHSRRSSLTALSPRSPNPPSSPRAPPPPTTTTTPTAHHFFGCVPSAALSKGQSSWYSNLFSRMTGRSRDEEEEVTRRGKLSPGELQKSKSTENVLSQEQPTKTSHDQRRRGSHASIHSMAGSNKAEDRDKGSSPLGSIQLTFIYSTQKPALLVTLTDIMLLSSKALFSDFKMKMRVLHTSSGVCLMKHKSSVSYRRGVIKPNAEFHFPMEIQNLSLQVLISVPGTHIFSRNIYVETFIDLNLLGLTESRALSKWFDVQKQAAV